MKNIVKLMPLTVIVIISITSSMRSSFFIEGFFINQRTTPHVWIGTSPFCTAKKTDCGYYDMIYVKSSKTGDGDRCLTGVKVQCRMKELNQPIIPANQTKHNQLKVLTFNIYQRPFIVSHDGQFVRTCHIPRAVLNNYPDLDLIVIEEGFLEGCFPGMDMRKMMSYYGFKYSTPTVGENGGKEARNFNLKNRKGRLRLTFTNGGVFMLSRWPLVQMKSHIYKNYTKETADILARKGVMYAKLFKNNGHNRMTYNLLGTHLQAQDGQGEDDTRYKQAGEIKDFVREKVKPEKSLPLLLIGDLNTDLIEEPQQVYKIMRNINFSIPQIIGSMNATYDPRVNDVVEPGSRPEWIDYTLYSNEHRQPLSATLEGRFLKTDMYFTYCSSAPLWPKSVLPTSDMCRKVHKTHFMSDHFPAMGTFTF